MNKRLIAKELIQIAKSLIADDKSNPFDGFLKSKVSNIINKKFHELTANKRYKDEYWQGVKILWDYLSEINADWTITKAEYKKDDDGNPISKTWNFEIYFMGVNENKQTIHGVCVASGCGSVEAPLSIYDVVAYVS